METEGQDTTGQESQGQEEVEVASGESPIEAQSSGTGINPAWNELLDVMPSSLHSQITPHLSKWDQNFQSKVQEVHSQYEPYKPYLENQVNPEQIDYALSILQAIEERPAEVVKALQVYVGADEEQGLENQEEDNGQGESPELFEHPEYQRMREMVETMAQLLVQQRQTETEAAEDSELEQDLKAARDQHGDYDEEWVLTKLYNNSEMTVDDAVKAYKEFESGIASRHRQPGPPVLGPGGSIPNQDFNPKNLDSQGKRQLVQQMLAQAAQQNQ